MLPLPEDKFARILVSRYQHARCVSTFPQNDLICDPRRHLGNVDHLMAVETKAFDDLEIDTLISQESHRGVVSKG
jgi:hypothetical protein